MRRTAEETLLQKLLRSALKQHAINARELSVKSGLGSTAVSDILAGRNKNPSAAVLQKIAASLAVPLQELLGGGGDIAPVISEPTIEVIGVAESGAFRDGRNLGASLKKAIAGPLHPRYPEARHFAVEIRDRAMDLAQPFPLGIGAHALCLDLASAGLAVEPGNIYTIRRSLDGGNTFETIVRRVLRVTQGVILRAESSDSFEDIALDALSTSADEHVHASGLVYAVVGFLAG